MEANRFRFRAWDKTHKIMSSIEDLENMSDGRMRSAKPAKDTFQGLFPELCGDIVWMQSTGLLDKNGKEIFEGDLLKWQAAPERPISTFPVSWNNNGYWQWGDHLPLSWEMGVVGNIYENPELLSPDSAAAPK